MFLSRLNIAFVSGLVFSLVFSVSIQACDESYAALSLAELKKITATLNSSQIVRSDFRQERVMRLLKKPLVAEGSMLYAPKHGLHWQVETPFQYSLTITPDYFLQQAQGQSQIIDAKEQPGVFSISRIFSGLLSGDLNSIKESFEIHGKQEADESIENNQAQTLCLIPKAAPFDQWMSHVELTISNRIEGIKMVDNNKSLEAEADYTLIVFSIPLDESSVNKTSNNSSLSDTEKNQFVRP